jgi:hypothetical protein
VIKAHVQQQPPVVVLSGHGTQLARLVPTAVQQALAHMPEHEYSNSRVALDKIHQLPTKLPPNARQSLSSAPTSQQHCIALQ